jgi:hypothetical protein
MPNDIRDKFIGELTRRYGPLQKLANSQSLFQIGDGIARIYIRYSRIHGGHKTFYGLRESDLRQLAGHNSFICLLSGEHEEPLILPFSEYEDVFQSSQPASDGQFKAQVYFRESGTEFYIARAGKHKW